MPPDRGTETNAEREAFVAARKKHFDEACREYERWEPARRAYIGRLIETTRFVVQPGARVLDLGCGNGDVLAAMKPSYGVGVDFAPGYVHRARKKHPHLRFVEANVEELDLGESFDYILMSDLVNELWDVQRALTVARRHSHSGTRLILHFHSNLWQPARRLAEWVRLAKPQLQQNWLTPADVANLLYLSGWEPVRTGHEVLFPFGIPLLAPALNRFAGRLWPLSELSLVNVTIARPQPEAQQSPEPIVSVVVAARNEEGHIPALFDRLPQLGGGTELVVVEGHSKDDTYGAVEREIARRPHLRCKLLKQTGKGKGNAVREGFAAASGEVLMILDADLTVRPEDLRQFYQVWRSGRGEFVNGVRLVYPREKRAMRFFNLLGNKFFSLAFTWLLGQRIKDTLCGTKVVSRAQYLRIAEGRRYFGEFDPFGDFDLLFGAAKLGLKIVDLPVRYGARAYGETNIQRWRHGVLLLRMVIYAMRRIKFV